MAINLKDAIRSRTTPRGQPYQIGAPADLPALPEPAGALPEPLQAIAREFMGARRRSGEALLEAARWLTEARTQAKHGDWQLFLEATSTSDDMAERLLNIYTRALTMPEFADAVRANLFSPTVAGLLARESTPDEVIRQAASAPTPPTKREIEGAIRRGKIRAGADSPTPSQAPAEPLHARLREAGAGLAWCAERAPGLAATERAALLAEVEQIAESVAALVAALGGETGHDLG